MGILELRPLPRGSLQGAPLGTPPVTRHTNPNDARVSVDASGGGCACAAVKGRGEGGSERSAERVGEFGRRTAEDRREARSVEGRRGGPFRRVLRPSLPVCGTFWIRVKGVHFPFSPADPAPWVTAAPDSTQGPFHLTICWSPDAHTCPGTRRRASSTSRLAAPGPERLLPPGAVPLAPRC